MFKFFIVLAIFGGIAYYTMRKRNIQISLSPSGQEALLGTARRIWLLVLRKFGLA
ncbi:MAG: hypothetical protein HQL97_08065 [Magnetococcales bacterium]|nr:hypothetical protein [Magnetococcales bacterium]MBF0261770.1 hypothetical protein [Magnetococcales bacterium]